MKETAVLWCKAARAPFLLVSLLPCILAGLLAAYRFGLDPRLFALVTLGVVMAHSAADFIDDYVDFKKGNLGNKQRQFHDSPLIDGKVTPFQVLVAAGLCLAVSLAAGLYAWISVGMPVLYMMVAGAFIVLFYTAPPFRLNYRGLGELALFLAFGPMIVSGVQYVLSGVFTLESFLLSIPVGIFTMNVGIVSNTFDHDDDLQSGKRTLALRLGRPRAVRFLAANSVAAYAVLIGTIVPGLASPWALLGVLGMPLALQTVKTTALFADASNYTRAMTHAIALASLTTVLFCVGYAIALWLR